MGFSIKQNFVEQFIFLQWKRECEIKKTKKKEPKKKITKNNFQIPKRIFLLLVCLRQESITNSATIMKMKNFANENLDFLFEMINEINDWTCIVSVCVCVYVFTPSSVQTKSPYGGIKKSVINL